MFQLPSAQGDRTRHFKNLNLYQEGHGDNARWMLGKFWQIDRSIYEEFLNVLPPVYCPGGFRMIERLTDEISATFLRVNNDYWCGYTDLTTTRPEKLLRHIEKTLTRGKHSPTT